MRVKEAPRGAAGPRISSNPPALPLATFREGTPPTAPLLVVGRFIARNRQRMPSVCSESGIRRPCDA